jgi:hypothetical protein
MTFYEDAWTESERQPHIRAEDWMAPPAGLEPALRQIVRLKRRLTLARSASEAAAITVGAMSSEFCP